MRARSSIVGLVVRTEQHAVEPLDERLFEPLDLSGAAGDGGLRARVRLDGGVEVVDDRTKDGWARGWSSRSAADEASVKPTYCLRLSKNVIG